MPALSSNHTSSLTGRVESAITKHPILRNRYFSSMQDGSMSLVAFRETQKQFFFSVRYFSRPMAALMARLPESKTRRGLIHNLAEEHGFEDEAGASGKPGFDPTLAHDLTFLAFLQALEVTAEDMTRAREQTSVRTFNLALIGACMMESTELAFACLGIIERAFADISSFIGKTVVERGWIPAGRLVHYKLHAEIDRRHAADFFREIEHAWKADDGTRAAVEDGIELGLCLFNKLYEDLYSDTCRNV